MGDTRTYEDFAGMLGRRVARVKEACGGAVGKKQYGGVQERPKTDEELKAAIVKADSLAGDRSVDGQRRLWEHLSGYPEIAGRYGTNPDQNLDWIPEDWFRALADIGVDTTGVAAWRRKYTPERADSLARAVYGAPKVTEKDGKGGNIMQYTVYFKDGGLLPRSQRRVYQTGGKASAQDTMQQLYQLTQVAMNGSGQEQQQAMQALGQFVGEAMNGNQQYAQIIQAVFDGAKKGSREMTQMAQVFQSIMQQMQKREFGGRLDYITMLRNGGRPRYQTGGEAEEKTYGEEIRDRLGKIGPIVKKLGRRLGFGKGAGKDVGDATEEMAETEPYDNPYEEPMWPPVYDEPDESPIQTRKPLPPEITNYVESLKDPYWYGSPLDYFEHKYGLSDSARYMRNLRSSPYPNWAKDLANTGRLKW